MATLSFYKTTTVPPVMEPDSLYFVQNGDYAETYVTNSLGEPRSVGNSEMINTLVAEALGQYEAGGLTVVPDIPARDALTLGKSTLVLVIDASNDPTVEGGSALYAYDSLTQSYIKVAEYESMDVVLEWGEIVGRPNSTVGQIDQAVANSHTHANKSELDKISEVGGIPKWDGGNWPVEWTNSNW